MRKTYIATSAEAKALHDGTQTAIITKIRVQPNKVDWNPIVVGKNKGWCDEHGRAIPTPYTIGQEVVVREAWMNVLDTDTLEITPEAKTGSVFENMKGCVWSSPATMPVSAARTRFRIVSCEAVRVRDVSELYFTELGIIKPDYSNDTIKSIRVNKILEKENHYDDYKSYIIHKLGQSAWDNNDYIFYYKIEKI